MADLLNLSCWIHWMKYYSTIRNDAEEAYWLTRRDVYNIVYSNEKAVHKIMCLETNFMTNTKQPINTIE